MFFLFIILLVDIDLCGKPLCKTCCGIKSTTEIRTILVQNTTLRKLTISLCTNFFMKLIGTSYQLRNRIKTHFFYTTFYDVLDQTVPLYHNSTKNKLYPSWYTKDIIKDLDNEKYNKSKLNYDIFTRLRHIIKIKIDLDHK